MSSNESPKSPTPIPNVLGKEEVWTPEAERLGQQIVEWIQLDLPGAHVYGVQRNGKSSAIRWFASSAAEFIGSPVFVTIFDIPRGLADRETSLTSEWLNQEGVLSNENSPARLRKKYRNHVIEQAKAMETDRILIIVDEAQNASRGHLGQIIYSGNVLASHGYRVFTLLVGQPELHASAEAYAAMRELQIVGRFFERGFEFLGIAPGDIDLVLKAHESEVRCPDGSMQRPAVASLFPEAWEAGWRPSAWAPALAEGVESMAQKCGLPKDYRIPMQHLRSTLIGLLLYTKANDDPYVTITPDVVQRALGKTGIQDTWARYAAARR
jgi:hypothetical protein